MPLPPRRHCATDRRDWARRRAGSGACRRRCARRGARRQSL